MIAAELRGGSKPSLNEALGWIGSRVDDIYGASVGRLEDVWIDPGTGVPRWLLVKEGRFGGRTTLIPFEDATAGAGHVWVPYERDIVREAPEIEPGAPLTQGIEAALRSHYSANAPAPLSHRTPPPMPPREDGPTSATVRFATAAPLAASSPEAGPEAGGPASPNRRAFRDQPQPSQPSHLQGVPPAQLPARPPPPISTPQTAPPQPYPQPREQDPVHEGGAPGWQGAPPAGPAPPEPQPSQPPAAAVALADALTAVLAADGGHTVEIELSGDLQIRGELRSVRIVPRTPPSQT